MGWESWSKLSAPADGDLLAVQDVSDTTGDASGTTKYMELTDLFAAYIAAKVRTLLGFAAGEDDLGEFTGTIIPDDSDIKEALQALETAFSDKADKAPAVNALGSVSSGTATLVNGYNTITVAGAHTWAFTWPTSGTVGVIKVWVTNGGSAAISGLSSVRWEGGLAPSLTSSGVDVLTFISFDGGTTIDGFLAGEDMQ